MASLLETVDPPSPGDLTSADILANVRALAPEIQSRGDEIAALRRLPSDLVLKLKAAGVSEWRCRKPGAAPR